MIAPVGNYALQAVTPETALSVERSRCVRHRCSANACTKCIDACPVNAISWSETGLDIDTGACTQCLACLAVCPTAALVSPEFSLLQLLTGLEDHPLPVLGCSGQPDTDAHARIPCLGYLAHLEVMVLLALVFHDGLHINLTLCENCPNGHILKGVELAFEKLKDLVPDHTVKLIRTSDRLDYQAPVLSRRQLFSMFREQATISAANLVERLQSASVPQLYGSKMVPQTRVLLLKAIVASSETLRIPLADKLFGKIIFTPQCTGSERCVGVCPTGAVQSNNENSHPPEFDRTLCVSCNSCQAFCKNHGVLMKTTHHP